MIRKCRECKKEFELNENTYSDTIYFEGGYYHHDCFITMCERKSKKTNAASKWGEALVSLISIKNSTKELVLNEYYKDSINNIMHDNYDVTVIPKSIYTKLSNIYAGTWKGMSKGISPEELLDMWERQLSNLNKSYHQREKLGKVMEPVARINYDISVLINKYDSYCKWKNNQKKIQEDQKQVVEDVKSLTYTANIGKNVAKQKKQDELDFEQLLDECF